MGRRPRPGERASADSPPSAEAEELEKLEAAIHNLELLRSKARKAGTAEAYQEAMEYQLKMLQVLAAEDAELAKPREAACADWLRRMSALDAKKKKGRRKSKRGGRACNNSDDDDG